MSVYVGIDVHRKRSQVAVVTEDGQLQLDKNVVNGSEPMLRLIADLPLGMPVASGAAFGWGWLVQLLEDYGFEPHLVHPLRCETIASARLKNNKVDAAILARLLRADLLPAASREIITYFLADIDGLAPLTDRIDGELHAHAKADPGSRCCGRCLVSGSSPPWSCSPRSATSTGSPAPASSPPGRLTPAGPVDLPDRLAQLNDLRASSGRVPDQHPPVGGSTANAFTEPSWRPSS